MKKTTFALIAFALFATVSQCFGANIERHTNSFVRTGVTYAQRGGMGTATYVVTNVDASALGVGAARPLPKYLHEVSYDDTYPDDAKWYYENAYGRHVGRCSAFWKNGMLHRNYDWHFDFAAEFLVRTSGNDKRFSSLGVASLGENMTEEFVTSGKPSRLYRCIPGMMLDGVNENGVAAEVNVNDMEGVEKWSPTGTVHVLAAVRWVLDNGTNALQAATYLARNVKRPVGMNFHYVVADASGAYVVENGAIHPLGNGRAVTNFALYEDGQPGEGKERYAIIDGGNTSITNVWYTRAYVPSATPWTSDIGTRPTDVWNKWNDGRGKEAHRGEEFSEGNPWWQTVHTAIYDVREKSVKVAVQETDEWYVFALDGGGRVKSVNGKEGRVVLDADDIGAYKRLRGIEMDDWGDPDDWENIESYFYVGGNTSGYDSGFEIDATRQIGTYMWGYFGSNRKYQALYLEPSGIAFDFEDENGDSHSFIGDFPTNDTASGTFITTGNIGDHALPNDYTALVSSGNFTNAVQDVECDPFFVPWCWLTSPWLGNGSSASGQFAQAFGFSSLASGYGSVAVGTDPTATANYAAAFGVQPQATGLYSMAVGNTAKASGTQASAFGYNAQAEGGESVALGHMAVASGYRSVAVGNTVIAEDDRSVIIGTTQNGEPHVSHGTNTLNFVATDNPDRIYFNDKTMRQVVQEVSPTPTEADPVFTQWKNANSTALGQSAKAGTLGVSIGSSANSQGGMASVAVGVQAKARDNYAVAIGYGADARGVMSVAIGESAIATNFASVAIGAGTDEIKAEAVRSHGNGTFNIGAKSLDKVWLGETNLLTLVQKASPPVELPEKWALANITNANGQAVGAKDVGAVGAIWDEYGYYTLDGNLNLGSYKLWLDESGDFAIGLQDNKTAFFANAGRFLFTAPFDGGEYTSPLYADGSPVLTQNEGDELYERKSDGWKNLTLELTDACTNSTADCECISTNICKLIEPHIEAVNVVAEHYDKTLEALWSVYITNGDMKFAVKTNEDTTAFMTANSVLKDKTTSQRYKVGIDDGEMKFFTNEFGNPQ